MKRGSLWFVNSFHQTTQKVYRTTKWNCVKKKSGNHWNLSTVKGLWLHIFFLPPVVLCAFARQHYTRLSAYSLLKCRQLIVLNAGIARDSRVVNLGEGKRERDWGVRRENIIKRAEREEETATTTKNKKRRLPLYADILIFPSYTLRALLSRLCVLDDVFFMIRLLVLCEMW